MKQFNLEEYLKNPSRKLITRDGRKVKRILCTDAMGPYPIVALIERRDGAMDNAHQYKMDGRYFSSGTDDSDLFFVPEKREGWINIFKGSNGNAFLGNSRIFESKEEAEEYGKSCECYVATVKIEWEQ